MEPPGELIIVNQGQGQGQDPCRTLQVIPPISQYSLSDSTLVGIKSRKLKLGMFIHPVDLIRTKILNTFITSYS